MKFCALCATGKITDFLRKFFSRAWPASSFSALSRYRNKNVRACRKIKFRRIAQPRTKNDERADAHVRGQPVASGDRRRPVATLQGVQAHPGGVEAGIRLRRLQVTPSAGGGDPVHGRLARLRLSVIL